MQSDVQMIARLRSMTFLIQEALRIADEGDDPLLGAKLSDCIDCIDIALGAAGQRSTAPMPVADTAWRTGWDSNPR